MVETRTTNWRTIITNEDRIRLRDWRSTFTAALNEARASGHSGEIDREGALLDPDSALASGPVPDGLYRCRTIELGGELAARRLALSGPTSTCEISQQGELQNFVQLSGSQRPIGSIFPSDGLRQVFLGTLVLGDESRALHYGADEKRGLAGYVDRVGLSRWRLVLPSPHYRSKLEVVELVPASRPMR